MIKGYFQGLHPAVSFTYFAAVIGMTLACMHPVLSPLSFLGAAAFLICLKGWKSLLGTMRFLLPMMLVIVVANPLFNHRGVTMLFMLFDQWITLEAIGYGAVSACQLAAVVLWFACYQEVITSDILFRAFGFGYVEFYPRIRSLAEGAGNLWQGGILILLYFLPVLLEKKEALRWRSYSMTA